MQRAAAASGGIVLLVVVALACGRDQPAEPDVPTDTLIRIEGGADLDSAFVREAIASLTPFKRATLNDPAIFESFLLDLASLGVLARRAERELLPGDPSLAHRVALARDRALAEAMIDAEIARRGPVDEAALQRFFAENPQFFQRSARVRFRQILVPRQEEAQTIAAELDGGASFDRLAREHSIHPSAARGGEMGWHEVDRLEPALREALAGVDVGEPSGIIETPFGLHLVEVQERASPGLTPFESVRDVVERRMRRTARREIGDALVGEIQASKRIHLDRERLAALHAELTQTAPATTLEPPGR